MTILTAEFLKITTYQAGIKQIFIKKKKLLLHYSKWNLKINFDYSIFQLNQKIFMHYKYY